MLTSGLQGNSRIIEVAVFLASSRRAFLPLVYFTNGACQQVIGYRGFPQNKVFSQWATTCKLGKVTLFDFAVSFVSQRRT